MELETGTSITHSSNRSKGVWRDTCLLSLASTVTLQMPYGALEPLTKVRSAMTDGGHDGHAVPQGVQILEAPPGWDIVCPVHGLIAHAAEDVSATRAALRHTVEHHPDWLASDESA